MRKRIGIIKRISALGLIFLLSINSFCAEVDDNDGSAFITKAEFDTLKSTFQAQIDTYNQNIDSKIDSAIASYLDGINLQGEKELNAILNNLSSNRRTFIGRINVPTKSGQSDIEITSNGFWGTSTINEGLNRSAGNTNVHGYAFIGFNNYQGGHGKGPVEKSNGKTGTYCFIDKGNVNNQDFWYLRENYTKKLKYQIFTWFAQVEHKVDFGKWVTKANTTNISWTARDSWAGEGTRTVGVDKDGYAKNVSALENITLNVTDSSSLTSWATYSTGDYVENANCGCITKDNQYYWTYLMTNQHYGNAASQAYTSTTNPEMCDATTWTEGTHFRNSYNGSTEYFNLSFYIPEVTMLPFANLCQQDTSIIAGIPTTYYNGLPLCEITTKGKLKIKFTLNRSNANGVVDVAIARDPFKNYAITSDSSTDIIYRTTIATSATEWGGTKNGTFEIEIDEDKTIDAVGKTLWMKCYCHNGTTAYTVTLSVDEIMQSYSN